MIFLLLWTVLGVFVLSYFESPDIRNIPNKYHRRFTLIAYILAVFPGYVSLLIADTILCAADRENPWVALKRNYGYATSDFYDTVKELW